MKKLMLTIDYDEHNLSASVLTGALRNIVGVQKVTPIVEATTQ
jgi:hypothetical protein